METLCIAENGFVNGNGLHDEIRNWTLLENAAHRLNSTLNLEQLLEKTVEEVSSTFGCSRSAVLLIDETKNELELVAVRGWSMEPHPKGFRFRVGLDGLVGQVASTGKTSYVPDVLLEPAYSVSEPTTRTELDIPLRHQGKVIGVFNAQHPEVDAFSSNRRKMFDALANHLAIAIQNARLFGKEQEAHQRLESECAEAHRMQMALLPRSAMSVSGFTLSGKCLPIRAVGGDWVDYFAIDSDRIGFALGDVSGKGMSAALLMASTRSALRQQARWDVRPATVMNRLNEILLHDFPRGNFLTMIYGVLDLRTAKLTLASAGHPPPVASACGVVQTIDISNGLPLGIRPQCFEQAEFFLPHGGMVMLYSDGLTEAASASGDDFGICGMKQIMLSQPASPQSVIEQVVAFSSEGILEDDASVLLVARS